jgi:hypothetical protein
VKKINTSMALYVLISAILAAGVLPVHAQTRPVDDDESGETVSQRPAVEAATGKPRIAVRVSERGDYSEEEKSALMTATINALVKSGLYDVIEERSDAIDLEQKTPGDDSVDDGPSAALGGQPGAQYLCVSDLIFLRLRQQTDNMGRTVVYHDYQVSSRIIDVETAEVMALGVADCDIQNGAAIPNAVASAVLKMLGTLQREETDSDAPKMAVCVQGESVDQTTADALYMYVLEALFTRSRYNGDFKVADRYEAFTKQIDTEPSAQMSGAFDYSHIASLGKQYGLKEILVVRIAHASGFHSISARTVNAETANIVKTSQMYAADDDLSELRELSVNLTEDIIKRIKTDDELEKERTSWWAACMVGGGYDMLMNSIDTLYSGGGGQFLLNIEYFKKNFQYLRVGLSTEIGGFGVAGKKALKREIAAGNPHIDPDSIEISSFRGSIGLFMKLYPISDIVYLFGGIGCGLYDIYAPENKSLNFNEVKIDMNTGWALSAGAGVNIYLYYIQNANLGVFIETQYTAIMLNRKSRKDNASGHCLSLKAGITFASSLYKPPMI